MMHRPLPLGKLPQDILERLLKRYGSADDRVVVGPGIGEDAAVIDFGDRYLVVKTDPITFATDEIGWYAIHITANDIAAMGATPKWFLATLLLPEGSADEALAEGIFASIHQAAEEVGVAVCGGHTEITHGIARPIVVGQMLGEVDKDRLVRSSGVRVGDSVLLTKALGIEATAILGRERGEELAAQYGQAFVERCRNYLYKPGISVLAEAKAACGAARVHAMHDPTEGGVATGLRELAFASGVGLEVDGAPLHVPAEAQTLCQYFGMAPLGVISSGALLIATAPEDTAKVKAAVERAGVRCDVIASARKEAFGLKLITDRGLVDLPLFERDEIARVLE